MFRHLSPAWLALGGSLALFGGLVATLYWTAEPSSLANEKPLVIYCAEALRVPVEATAREYHKEYGQEVVLRFGPSQTILATMELTKDGDLFVPADDSYVRMARHKKLVGETLSLARMQAVVAVRPGYPRAIKTWSDFLTPGSKIGLGNTDATAIGKVLKEKLEESGRWKALAKLDPNYMVNVNEVANAVKLGSVDLGVVWDVTARMHPSVTVVKLPELDNVQARVQVAVVQASTQPSQALRFARYLRAANKGAKHFKAQGFSDVDATSDMSDRPELLVYAGSMLRPAVEQTIIDFEKREGVRITRVYNGCGILVSQMKAGEQPDLYFACDTKFMADVQDLFNEPTSVSSNQLVITVKRDNPHQLKALIDLAKPGLKVGVGHEQQCALGALTKETFIRTGTYAQVMKNVVVQSPTGDFLVNQIRTGSLDVVVAYRSNVAPFADELLGIPITGIPCAAPLQPVAVGRNSAHPELTQRLMQALQTAESKERFEKLGFGWETKK